MIALVSVAFVGCLQGTEEPTEAPTEPPTVPGADVLDLDPLLANQTDPYGPLHQLNLTSETLEPITPTFAADPWIVDSDRVLHEYTDEERRGLALTHLATNNSTPYNGSFSDSKDAKYPSADPSGEHVYFSHGSPREDPKIIRRPIEPGGKEEVVAELRSQDKPQGHWAVSPNRSLLAGSVWSGGADGPPTHTVLDVTQQPPDHVAGASGDHPRFLPDGTIVFAGWTNGLYVLDPETDDVSSFVRDSDHETLHQPTVAGDQVWFHARVDHPDGNRTWEEIRHVSLTGGDQQTVAWTEDYRLGPFDVHDTGQALVMQVYGPTRDG
ncbi:hypothetical protein BRD56_02340 [Thermoplasmatales archaeon SW_10_69_26]|nr:MAG: hypothetical protein BRD56_02340 [Thermoplasmatales archaeon SW_10_69_26]